MKDERQFQTFAPSADGADEFNAGFFGHDATDLARSFQTDVRGPTFGSSCSDGAYGIFAIRVYVASLRVDGGALAEDGKLCIECIGQGRSHELDAQTIDNLKALGYVQ